MGHQPTLADRYWQAVIAVPVAFVWLACVAFAVWEGFLAWGIQQLLLCLALLGMVPALNSLPGFSAISTAIDGRVRRELETGNTLQFPTLVLRSVPPFSFGAVLIELPLIVPFLLIGLPLDLAVGFLLDQVDAIPVWGRVVAMDFQQQMIAEAVFTLLSFPYLLMMATSYRAARIRAGKQTTPQEEVSGGVEDVSR